MKNIFVVVCAPREIPYLAEEQNSDLFYAPHELHTYRKFKDVCNFLNLDVSFRLVSLKEETLPELNADFDDVVVFASPLTFLASGKALADGLNYVLQSELGYATVGSALDLYCVIGTGKMLTEGSCGTPLEFINHIQNCGAKCTQASFLEGEKGTPSSRSEYFERVQTYRKEFLDYLIMTGVKIDLRDGVVIAPNTEIHRGTEILPGSIVKNNSIIFEHAKIGPNAVVSHSEIGVGCQINASTVEDSKCEGNVQIGPYSHIRQNCHLMNDVRIGNAVELKNCVVGANVKIPHEAYLGDADIGESVTIGANVVTVNYDERAKNDRVVIGRDAVIGCNTSLVAPISIGQGAFTAAGSTITDSVPPYALAIAREYQTNHENWAKRRKRK